jgi:hypothetical protein
MGADLNQRGIDTMTRVYKGRRRSTSLDSPVVLPAPALPQRSTDETREFVLRKQVENICRPILRHPEAQPPADPMPVWFAALIATRCHVSRNGVDQAVLWNCVSGRALYTNLGSDPELIRPLGVQLQRGQTLAVYWTPGESEYTLEVLGHAERVA